MRRAVVLALALWAVLAASASADVFDDNPATASRGVGDQWVFARANNGETLVRHLTASGSWSDWESLGGNAGSGPAAVAYGSEIWVFARSADGTIDYKRLTADGWSAWATLGGFATSAPAVTARRGTNLVDVVVRGGDNTFFHQAFVPGVGWSGWATIDGNLTSGPAINSQSSGLLNIWGRGVDGTLMQKSWTGTEWTGWASLGGGIVGAPQTVARVENGLNVYVRGAGNATYARSWSGAWSDWILLDQFPIDSSPAAGGDPNTEWIYARKGDRLVRKEWNGAWQPWTDFGPVAVPPPPAPAPPTPVLPDGEANLETGVRCTPAGGRLRVKITVRKPTGKRKARVSRIVFYTKGKGRAVRSDRKSPFVVRIRINRPAGTSGRVYARVYYRRSARGKLHRKTVSRRYTVCR
jgi:hypothetical protein